MIFEEIEIDENGFKELKIRGMDYTHTFRFTSQELGALFTVLIKHFLLDHDAEDLHLFLDSLEDQRLNSIIRR